MLGSVSGVAPSAAHPLACPLVLPEYSPSATAATRRSSSRSAYSPSPCFQATATAPSTGRPAAARCRMSACTACPTSVPVRGSSARYLARMSSTSAAACPHGASCSSSAVAAARYLTDERWKTLSRHCNARPPPQRPSENEPRASCHSGSQRRTLRPLRSRHIGHGSLNRQRVSQTAYRSRADRA